MKYLDPENYKRSAKLQLLNLGCGTKYHPSWVNIDFVSSGTDVIGHDLTSGIPFPDASFDAVYHSHVLEHFTTAQGAFFIRECHRVLKPGGIIRIAVPNLEVITRNYITYLEASLRNEHGAFEKYEWTKLELYDQVARNRSGGEYRTFLDNSADDLKKFANERLGAEIDLMHKERVTSTLEKLKSKPFRAYSRAIKLMIAKALLRLVGGKNLRDTLQIGLVRLSGEIHYTMYDRLSLRNLLEQNNFAGARVTTAFESAIPGFQEFHLDTVNNKVRKPDSLFMEAIKK